MVGGNYVKAKALFIFVMLIFGSIGLFVKNIELSSSELALFRGAIGSVFLIVASLFLKQKVNFNQISKKNLILLLFSGTAMGFNWIFLFEAYRYTTISNATLSYYFAPIFVMVLAPFLLKERWTTLKAISILLAFTGFFLIVQPQALPSNVGFHHGVGIGYGLLAAAFYASVILLNKFIRNLSDFETTIMQLTIATIVLLPYVLFTEEMNYTGISGETILLILVVGVFHTGIAYLLYFAAIKKLKGQTIAVFSYIDPISAVLMAAIVLHENMGLVQIIGGVLILGSTLLSELKLTKDSRLMKS